MKPLVVSEATSAMATTPTTKSRATGVGTFGLATAARAGSGRGSGEHTRPVSPPRRADPAPAPSTRLAPPDGAPANSVRSLRARLVCIDTVAAGIAWSALNVVVVASRHAGLAGVGTALALTAVATGLTLGAMGGLGLRKPGAAAARATAASRLLWSSAAGGLGEMLVTALFGSALSVGDAAAGALASFLALFAARSLYGSWLTQNRARGRFVRPLLLIGTRESVDPLATTVGDHPELGYRVCGYAGPADPPETAALSVRRVGALADAPAVAKRLGAAAMVAAAGVPGAELDRLVQALGSAGTDVYLSPGVSGIDYRRIRPVGLSHEPLMRLDPIIRSRWQAPAKRLLDVACAVFVLTLSFPLLVLAALAVKLDSRGPVLFRQVRVGRNGTPITVLKLRTMVSDAERWTEELNGLNERSGPLFKLSADPRVTTVGRLLRASSIDELPQLFNVLRGEMSMVGPRPALTEEVEQFDEALRHRADVTPGITGLWQLEARDNPSFHSYRRLDLFYVNNWSLSMDLSIMVSTIGAVAGRAVRVLRSAPAPHAPSARLGSSGRSAIDVSFSEGGPSTSGAST